MSDLSTSYRLHRTLFVTQSLFTASQLAIFTLLSIVATELSGTDSAAGLPTTALTFTQSLSALVLGIAMGRYGRRFGLTISYGAAGVGAFIGMLAIISGSFPLLLLSSGLIGAGRAGADQSRFAAGELFPEKMRARMIGRIVFAGTIGAIVGPALVGPASALAQGLGFNEDIGPWMIGTVMFSLATMIILFLLRPDPMQVHRQIEAGEEKPKNTPQKGPPVRPVGELLRLPNVQLAILAMLISQTVMVVLMVMTPLHMSHNDHGNAAVSFVIAAHTLGMFGLSSVTGNLIDRYGKNFMLIVGASILILAALLAPISASLPILTVALFLLGLGWNFSYIAGSTLLSEALQGEERSRIQGINDMFIALSAGLGSLSAGPLFSTGGFFAVSMLGLIMTVLLVWFIYWFTRRQTLPEHSL